jgi:hypothetical protein
MSREEIEEDNDEDNNHDYDVPHTKTQERISKVPSRKPIHSPRTILRLKSVLPSDIQEFVQELPRWEKDNNMIWDRDGIQDQERHYLDASWTEWLRDSESKEETGWSEVSTELLIEFLKDIVSEANSGGNIHIQRTDPIKRLLQTIRSNQIFVDSRINSVIFRQCWAKIGPFLIKAEEGVEDEMGEILEAVKESLKPSPSQDPKTREANKTIVKELITKALTVKKGGSAKDYNLFHFYDKLSEVAKKIAKTLEEARMLAGDIDVFTITFRH